MSACGMHRVYLIGNRVMNGGYSIHLVSSNHVFLFSINTGTVPIQSTTGSISTNQLLTYAPPCQKFN